MKHHRAGFTQVGAASRAAPGNTVNPPRLGGPTGRAGFTLFEVILAIALAAVLLTLIGTAINLYLHQVDADRTRVEESQLARSILAMIADDIRATTVYQPQDTSSVAKVMAKTAAFNVDDIDKATAAGASSATGAAGIANASAATGGAGAASSASSSASTTSTDGTDSDTALPLGINGSPDVGLYVDATRLPKQEELFSTTTGYSNVQSPNSNNGPGSSATSSGGVPATDLKTIRYYIRPGEAVEAGSASVTSLDPASQSRVGGLVRQEIPRAMRNFAEKNGGSLLDSNAAILAPEVVHMEIRFFDGSEITDTWDMKELKKLPVAVEIRVWLRSPNATGEPITANMDAATLASSTHQYRQVVYLPMAQIANAAKSSSSDSTSTTDSANSTDASSGNESASGSGSAFGNE